MMRTSRVRVSKRSSRAATERQRVGWSLQDADVESAKTRPPRAVSAFLGLAGVYALAALIVAAVT